MQSPRRSPTVSPRNVNATPLVQASEKAITEEEKQPLPGEETYRTNADGRPPAEAAASDAQYETND